MVTRSTPKQRAVVAVKSLQGSKRAVLGTREARPSRTHKLTTPTLLGEPRKFAARISSTSNGRMSPTKWEKGRERKFRKRLTLRKARRTSIGHWRRSRKRIRPR